MTIEPTLTWSRGVSPFMDGIQQLAIQCTSFPQASRSARCYAGARHLGVSSVPFRDRMDECCNEKAHELAQLQGRVLRAVLAINAAMFAIEFLAGLLAGSMALLGDSLDMLGDTLVYGLSLYALHRGAVWQARAPLSKGMVMLGFGGGGVLETVHKLVVGSVPPADVMGLVGTVALAANAVCFALLYRHRS